MVASAAFHAPAPASYTVRPGDTLSQLALDFYGKPQDWPSIWHDNPRIKNPNLIFPGENVKLPGGTATTTATAAIVHPAQKPPPHPAYTPRHAAAPKPKFTPKAAVVHAPQHTAVTTAAAGNMAQIARYFVSHGATKAAAAGVAACIWGESEGNPESVGSGGFGLIGWTGNNTGLPRGYYGPTGNVAYDMETQLAGVVGYINANGGWGPVNRAGGPVAAAEVFSADYEKPAVLYSDIHYGGAGDPTLIFGKI